MNEPTKRVIRLSIDFLPDENQVFVNGPVHLKTLCVNILCDAIKAVANSKDVTPPVQSLLNGHS